MDGVFYLGLAKAEEIGNQARPFHPQRAVREGVLWGISHVQNTDLECGRP